MYKILIKNILVFIFPLYFFGTDFAYAHKKFDIKNKSNIETKKPDNNFKSNYVDNEISEPSNHNVADNLMKSFDNYPSFEESIKPEEQFKNLFRKNDRELKKSVFRLWKIYEKEMSNQIGTQRLNGPDIDNTFNESLNSLSK